MFTFFKKVPSVSIEDLTEAMKGRVSLLDVRSSDEYRSGHINKAKNIEIDKLPFYKQDKNLPIYVICHSGMRSRRATKLLCKFGYDAKMVKGGMSAWTGEIKGGK